MCSQILLLLQSWLQLDSFSLLYSVLLCRSELKMLRTMCRTKLQLFCKIKWLNSNNMWLFNLRQLLQCLKVSNIMFKEVIQVHNIITLTIIIILSNNINMGINSNNILISCNNMGFSHNNNHIIHMDNLAINSERDNNQVEDQVPIICISLQSILMIYFSN